MRDDAARALSFALDASAASASRAAIDAREALYDFDASIVLYALDVIDAVYAFDARDARVAREARDARATLDAVLALGGRL